MSALSIVRTSPADFLKVEEISGDDRIQEEMAQITKLWKWAAKERIDSASNEEEKERNCIQLKFLSSDPTNLCKPSRFRGGRV